MIKSVYRVQVTHQCFVFDEEGIHLRKYDGHFDTVKDQILADAPEDADFYITRWGQGNFEKITREQWAKEKVHP